MKNLAKTDEKKDLVTREDLEKIELTPGPKGDPGKDGHVLQTYCYYEGKFRNHKTEDVIARFETYYDGERVTAKDGVVYCVTCTSNGDVESHMVGVHLYYDQDEGPKYDNVERKYGKIETNVRAKYKGLEAFYYAELVNINDGAKGDSLTISSQTTLGNGDKQLAFSDGTVVTIPRGADGQPGKGIVNTCTGETLKYWCGTQSQYDAIHDKDNNTIYDITVE